MREVAVDNNHSYICLVNKVLLASFCPYKGTCCIPEDEEKTYGCYIFATNSHTRDKICIKCFTVGIGIQEKRFVRYV